MKVHGTTFKGKTKWFTDDVETHAFHNAFYVPSILRGRKLSEYPGLSQFCEELYSKHIRSPFLFSLMVDICEEKVESKSEDTQEQLTKALGVHVDWNVLACSHNAFYIPCSFVTS